MKTDTYYYVIKYSNDNLVEKFIFYCKGVGNAIKGIVIHDFIDKDINNWDCFIPINSDYIFTEIIEEEALKYLI